MTHEQKLQELIIDIREKLPRLNKPEEGDLIFYKGDIFNLHYNCDSDEADVELQHANGKWIEFSICDFTEHLDVGEIVLICSPMLNDVLEWFTLNPKGRDFSPTGMGNLILRNYNKGTIDIQEWELSNPYLRNQSEELIDFLHNLIKK